MNTLKITDKIYPSLLKQIYRPPKNLFYKGSLDCLNKTCVAIVGTREASEYGEEITKQIVSDFAGLDICIVSGLAKGIDTIAHKAALANNLSTIAVLGSGINNIYPPENLGLSSKVDLVLSEYPGAVPPASFHFPQRNRIISGLSIATVVIEAKEKSGAFITAKLAIDQGREVFTVPGDFYRETSRGPLRLLQDGVAFPVASGSDILDALKIQPAFNFSKTEIKSKPDPFNLSNEESAIFLSLHRFTPTTISKLEARTNLSIEKILSALSILELKGLIRIEDGKYFRKC